MLEWWRHRGSVGGSTGWVHRWTLIIRTAVGITEPHWIDVVIERLCSLLNFANSTLLLFRGAVLIPHLFQQSCHLSHVLSCAIKRGRPIRLLRHSVSMDKMLQPKSRSWHHTR